MIGPPAEGTPRGAGVRPVISLLFCVGTLCFLNNLLVGPLFDSGKGALVAITLGMVLGIVLGQINLVSIWAAIAEGPLIVRLPWAFLLVVIVWMSLVLGSRSDITNEESFTLGVLLAVGCSVAQVPLWIASRKFRWRLSRPEGLGDAKMGQFNLTHMFVGTLCLALALAVCRVLFSLDAPGGIGLMDYVELYIALSVMTLVNLVTVVPAIWAAFYLPFSFRWVAIGTLVVTVITAVECLGLTMVFGSWPGSDELFLFWGLNMAQVLAVYVVLRLLRRLGFQLNSLAGRSNC